jgi:hypothetical protein
MDCIVQKIYKYIEKQNLSLIWQRENIGYWTKYCNRV